MSHARRAAEALAVSSPQWLHWPEAHDFTAAYDYLTLLFDPNRVNWTIDKLSASIPTVRKAKDIMRASGLMLLPKSDESVAKDLKKIQNGTPLSPVLLVRSQGYLYRAGVLHIADGYHRVCACYHHGDDTEIPCLLASLV